jgi:ribonucleoside-diphosphate reductase alpha chain
MGPTLPISEEVHALKYRQSGESFREAMSRIADALKDDQSHFDAFREILFDMRFLPAGRVQAAVGAARRVTPYNCFVAPTIPDSMNGIMDVAKYAAETMRLGGGIGYDFSTIRPRKDRIASLDSEASGPVSFMAIFDSLCGTIASAGHRRGAQMGVLRVDHPDIEEFIRAKQNSSRLTNFNISVGITDHFMRCVSSGEPFALMFDGRVHRTVDAKALWNEIMRSTWDWAEPGVLFIDTINRMNNLSWCEQITATNPCAEQPLPPNGACLLGSFNLVRYIVKDAATGHEFNWDQFVKDIPIVVRAMDKS